VIWKKQKITQVTGFKGLLESPKKKKKREFPMKRIRNKIGHVNTPINRTLWQFSIDFCTKISEKPFYSTIVQQNHLFQENVKYEIFCG
jgi:hypothetical protein